MDVVFSEYKFDYWPGGRQFCDISWIFSGHPEKSFDNTLKSYTIASTCILPFDGQWVTQMRKRH
jgi:hypothetical protein